MPVGLNLHSIVGLGAGAIADRARPGIAQAPPSPGPAADLCRGSAPGRRDRLRGLGHDSLHLGRRDDRGGLQGECSRLFDAKETGAASFTQDGDCRGNPHEDHHPYDSRRQPAHQTGLAVTVVTFAAVTAVVAATSAAFVAAAKAEAALAEATLAAAIAEAALAAFIAA